MNIKNKLCNDILEFNSLNKNELRAVNKVMENGLLSGFLAMPDKNSYFGGLEILNLEKKWKKDLKLILL